MERVSTDTFTLTKWGTVLVSVVILVVLGLQTIRAFELSCARQAPPFLPAFQFVCGAGLYPFVSYPMYSRAHYEGEAINKYVIVGEFADGSEVTILPEAIGMTFWLFERNVIRKLLAGDDEPVLGVARLYRRHHGEMPVALFLEDHQLVLQRDGAVPGEVVSLAVFPVGQRFPVGDLE